jgi:AraC family transcriptional regulator
VTPPQPYHTRLQRVLHHIEAHLDDDLSVEALSSVAAFSKHHFHRQFAASFGIGVYKYVQMTRLKRASYRLAFRNDMLIIQIALDSGYEAPEAFARAFKQRIGQTPGGFRKRPDWQHWQAVYQPISETRTKHMKRNHRDAEVTIVEVQDTHVAVLEHRGDPALIGNTIQAFIAWRKQVGLPPRISATFNIFYNDPNETPPVDFRLDLCAEIHNAVAANTAGVIAKVIPGGRCAVLRHTGSDDGLGNAIDYLYADWLPRSGHEPRDFPLYCQRISSFPDVAEHQAVTDIFVPLK